MITHERLKELFRYENGILVRNITTSSKAIKGTSPQYIDKDGYLIVSIDRRKYRVHRLVFLYFNGEHPSLDIDHIDGDRINNKIENLRHVSRAVNMHNLKSAHRDNAQKLLGAFHKKGSKVYFSRIHINGKSKYIGTYSSAIDAHQAYLKEKRKYHEGNTL